MFKIYNKVCTEPDVRKLKLIETKSAGNKFTSPKAYYDNSTNTLLILYKYLRICPRDKNAKYEIGYHLEYTKRSISHLKLSNTKLTELALSAISEDLKDSGLRGLTFNYYNSTTSSVVPNPWIAHFSSYKTEDIAQKLFCLLDLERKQTLFVQPGPGYLRPLFKEILPNRRTLFSYGTWEYCRKPFDKNGLTGIAYSPKALQV